MPVTPIYGLPSPALTDPPDGPANIGALAQATENAIQTQTTTLASSIATLANPPRAQLRQIVTQNVATNTWDAVTFTAEDHDSHNGHSNAVNTSRYTAQINGLYQFSGSIWWAANATGVRLLRWYKNGSPLTGSGLEYDAVTSGGAQSGYPAKVFQIPLLISDYVELFVWQNGASPLATFSSGADAQSTMTVLLVRNDNF